MTQALDETNQIPLTYVDTTGKRYEIHAIAGDNLMLIAKAHSVRGIDGDCGGNAACGTCLTRVDASIRVLLSPTSEDELELIDSMGASTTEHRLGCQIRVTPQLSGCTFYVGQPT
jgi:ferredoxin